MAFFHCDKGSATRCSKLLIAITPYSKTLCFNLCPIRLNGHRLCAKTDFLPRRGRRPELHMKVGRHRTRRGVPACLFHQRKSRRPIGMAIQKGSDDSPIHHSWKCLVMLFRSELGGHFPVFANQTSNSQALLVFRAAPEANAVGRVGLLQTFHSAIRASMCVRISPFHERGNSTI